MNIHEYQAKQVLANFGVATPRGILANTPEEAENLTDEQRRVIIQDCNYSW